MEDFDFHNGKREKERGKGKKQRQSLLVQCVVIPYPVKTIYILYIRDEHKQIKNIVSDFT